MWLIGKSQFRKCEKPQPDLTLFWEVPSFGSLSLPRLLIKQHSLSPCYAICLRHCLAYSLELWALVDTSSKDIILGYHVTLLAKKSTPKDKLLHGQAGWLLEESHRPAKGGPARNLSPHDNAAKWTSQSIPTRTVTLSLTPCVTPCQSIE